MGVWQIIFIVGVLFSSTLGQNPPVFTKENYTAEISESEPNGFVVPVDIEANDDDGVIYSIDESTGAFEINNETGEVTILDTNKIDYEDTAEITVTIVATDLNSNPSSSSASLIITLTNANDNFPVFKQAEYTFTVLEEETGAFVGEVEATDDDGDTLIYSIIDGALTDFTISTEDGKGVIRVATKLDFETETDYSFSVAAGDGTNINTTTVHVVVTDIIDQRPVVRPFLSELIIDLDTNQRSVDMSHLSVTDDSNLYSGVATIKYLFDDEEQVSKHTLFVIQHEFLSS